MLFHENRLLAEDSHEISYLIFVKNWEKMLQNLSSAAVVIGALRDKIVSFISTSIHRYTLSLAFLFVSSYIQLK